MTFKKSGLFAAALLFPLIPGRARATVTQPIHQMSTMSQAAVHGVHHAPGMPPNPCVNDKGRSTVTNKSVKSGNWSNPALWSARRVPTSGDIVEIKEGTTVSFDSNEGKAGAVCVHGELDFRTDINTQLTVTTLMVHNKAIFTLGTPAHPVQPTVTATLVFNDEAPSIKGDAHHPSDPEQWLTGFIAMDDARVTFSGSPLDPTFVRLDTRHYQSSGGPQTGETTLSLSEPVSGWKPGDRLILPDTRELTSREQNPYVPEWEELTLISISGDGKTLTLSAPLQYSHPGARNGAGTLEFLGHVGNLSRNVIVKSANPQGTRGHVAFLHQTDVDVEYALFKDLGRTTFQPLDDTMFDAKGNVTHIGTNPRGRYALHAHHLIGTNPPTHPHQFTFKGNAIDDGGPGDSPFRWGITVHASHYGLIQDNVVYNKGGAGIATEDGSESYNVFDHNFVVRTPGSGERQDAGTRQTNPDVGRTGSSFWFSGPNNFVRNNVAANPHVVSDIAFTQSGYAVFNLSGSRRIPTSPGADPLAYVKAGLLIMPLREFNGNEAYGTQTGLTLWFIGAEYGQLVRGVPESALIIRSMPQSVVKDFSAWNFSNFGYFGYLTNHVALDHPVFRGSDALAVDPGPTGFWTDHYLTLYGFVKNADIQGLGTGIVVPNKVGETSYTGSTLMPFTVQDSSLRNHTNIKVVTMAGGSDSRLPPARFLTPRQTIIRNVKFDTINVSTSTPRDIAMVYNPVQSGQSHLSQMDQVLVYGYNQVPRHDFQVFYIQQASRFIIPKTDSSNPGTLGSPEAGLTNARNWAQYKLAIAGMIAPCLDTVTHPAIQGFTCSLGGQ